MSKRDLFRIIIRVYAIYSLIIGILYIVPQNIGAMSYEIQSGMGGYSVLVLILSVAFVFALTMLLNRKADTIINWFKLDQGYDTNEAPLSQFNTEFIFTIASVIIGGFLIIDYAPLLILQTYNAFKLTQQYGNLNDSFKTEWALSVVRILVGYLLIKFAPKMHLLVHGKKATTKDQDSSAE
jgi:hypothetical protein